MKRYSKPDDSNVLKEINDILKIRSTYGYKRITAMINQKRKKENKTIFNKKRIYRVMEMNGLLLPKKENTRDKSKKTGKVMTLHSNTRWCSDCFEIKCYNGEKVYVTFSLDCRDREAISYIAKPIPILADDIQKLMVQSVINRFDHHRAPRQIEWLSDRGAIYRASNTIDVARTLSLKSCFTAAYSPESNGMAEAFVGTIKRDYVYTSDCKNSKTVLKLLPKWIEDYNKNAPHSALGMKSPWEFQNKINPELAHEQGSWVEAGGDHLGVTTTRMGVSEQI